MPIFFVYFLYNLFFVGFFYVTYYVCFKFYNDLIRLCCFFYCWLKAQVVSFV